MGYFPLQCVSEQTHCLNRITLYFTPHTRRIVPSTVNETSMPPKLIV